MATKTPEHKLVINRKSYEAMRQDPVRLEAHRLRTRLAMRARRKTPEYKKYFKQYHQNWRQAIKEACINMYSNGDACCAWCPQADIDVLCLDHIENNGKAHRFEINGKNGTSGFYRHLQRLDYPPGLQVLCANCNLKKEIVRRREERIARGH